MDKPIEKIIVDIIKYELQLPDNYGKTSRGDVIPSVIIYAQNIKLFNTDKLQITVRTVNTDVWANNTDFKVKENGTYWEISEQNIVQMMQIDLYSRNNEAKTAVIRSQVPRALKSVYAEQQMDLYNFKIQTTGIRTQNLSGIDGGSDINRFAVTFSVLTHEREERQINYYDKFGVMAETENGEILNINNYD